MTENTENMLLVEKKGLIVFLTIHYPKKRNALSPKILIDLHKNLEAFSKDDTIRCVVIKGSGSNVFSSGYDISAIPVDPLPDTKQKTPDVLVQALDTIKNYPYPTIAMLNGHAFGAGLNLCACCDIRIAAEDIKLGMTAARLGVGYHPKGVQQFIEAFGIARTKELFFTANIYEGNDLIQKGLVDYLIPKQELETFTLSYAEQITRNAPLSLKAIKKTIAMFENKAVLNQEDITLADQLMQSCFQSDDLKEGQAAFLEKRAPIFKGK
ncbi:MAG: enoyl-CoA hydratase [Desulfobacteraceae bacterium]|nr:enoyl-CoA hydratase [Desulfobacteraceae bacterium]